MRLIFWIQIFISILASQTNSDFKAAKNILKNSGMTELEVRSIAKDRGYSEQQIDKVMQNNENQQAKKSDLDQFLQPNQNLKSKKLAESNANNVESESKVINDSQIQEQTAPENEQNLEIESKSESIKNSMNYFGYDIFKRDPALFQSASVGAVDPDYLIGPNDEIIVLLWGDAQFRQVISVNREGFIFIPEIGQVFVNGLTLNLLESKLFRVLSKSYASLNPAGKKATTFLDVSLGNLRPLRIQVVGEVNQPGAYTVNPSATLLSSLYYFNGPNILGSLRDIRLIRNGEKIASIDFYDYLLTGKSPRDSKLQLDDVVFIPKRDKTVYISGEVNRPGIYELKEGEFLKDIISISGGLKVTAYLDRVQIDRIVPFEEREKLGMDRMIMDLSLKENIESEIFFEIQDQDKIKIFSVLDLRENIVNIEGAVTRPGTYDMSGSLKLRDLVLKADSLLSDAYLERLDIIRINPDMTKQLIKLNLEKVMDGDPTHNIDLHGMDNVIIYRLSEMVPTTSVSINGHVKKPGTYQLLENMTLYDLVFKTGGFADPKHKKKTYLNRAEIIRTNHNSSLKDILPFDLGLVLENKGISSELLLPDDMIRIYSLEEVKGSTRFVSISGNVKKPGTYELFEGNMTLYDLIFLAGGLDDLLHRGTTHLDRADLIRYDDDFINQEIITFNLRSIIEDKNHSENLVLLPGDQVKIYSKNVFNFSRSVSISGSVRSPGKYSYKQNMTLKDLIIEAGGVSEDVYRYKIEIARIDPNSTNEDQYAESILFDLDKDYSIVNFNENYLDKDQDFILVPYDLVSLRPDPFFQLHKIVTIEGAVYYPGEYTILNSAETISDIITRAGGFKTGAYAYGSKFIRDGKEVQVDIEKIAKNPKSKANIIIQGGDKIFISEKPGVFVINGEVHSPGFYKFERGNRVKDAIANAGGLSQDANPDQIFISYPNGKSKKYKGLFYNPKIKDGSVVTVGTKEEKEPFDYTEYDKELTSIMASVAQTIAIIGLARN